MKDLNKEFPITSSYTYLNTPFTGVLSTYTQKKIQELEEDYRQRGSLFSNQYEDFIVKETKELIAEVYTANIEGIGILNNFSTGLNLILNDIPKSSKVVLLAQDYPSVNLPVKSRNFEVEEVDIDLNLYSNLRHIFKTEQPQFFIFSLTQFMSGFQMDLGVLTQLKNDFPSVYFIADATQYCGTEAFDFHNSPLDVFGTSGYKWLSAGFGNAFFLMKPSFLSSHDFKSIGSNSLIEKPSGKVRLTGFLEPGHFDILAVARLKLALEFHYKHIGIQLIESRIKQLSKFAKAKFLKLNLLDTSIIDTSSHQHIFSLKGEASDVQNLEKHSVLASFRGGRIRVGFQYFNTEKDLNRLLEVLPSL